MAERIAIAGDGQMALVLAAVNSNNMALALDTELCFQANASHRQRHQ